jgi:hypothetical protein
MKDKFERTWKEAVLVYLQALFQRTEGSQQTPEAVGPYPTFGPIAEPEGPRPSSNNANNSTNEIINKVTD